MLKPLTLICSLSLLAASAHAQDWREKLGADLVTIRDGKMVYQEFGVAKIEFAGYEPSQFQLKLYSEAPQAGAISRDNFVGLSASFFTLIMVESLAQAYDVTAAAFLEAFNTPSFRTTSGVKARPAAPAARPTRPRRSSCSA
jgi:hypothetical protein